MLCSMLFPIRSLIMYYETFGGLRTYAELSTRQVYYLVYKDKVYYGSTLFESQNTK